MAIAEVDPRVGNWMDETGNDEPLEVIVEARLPKRFVTFESRTGAKKPAPVAVVAHEDRATIFSEFVERMRKIAGGSLTVLPSAGAVAVRATRSQIAAILADPLVKAVRPNKR